MIFLIFVLFISHYTNGAIVFYSDNIARDGDLGNRATTNALCASIAPTISPPLTCTFTTALLSYAGDGANQIPITYAFPTSMPVVGPTGTAIGVWGTMFPPTPVPTPTVVLTNSLESAGVISTPTPTPTPRYWTGQNQDGSASLNCDEWRSIDEYIGGVIGTSNTNTATWATNAISDCNLLLKFVCVCIPPTVSPTQNPTLKPTLKPTTISPTKDPTAPTTTSPTNKPTFNPTDEPTTTANPTTNPNIASNLQQVMYLIPAGTVIEVYRPIGNISYFTTQTDVNSPVNITLTLLNNGAAFPIKWTSVFDRLYNVTTNTTDTQQLEECNPIRNRLPGTTPSGLDGVVICPIIYKCLSSDCTDELAPIGSGNSEWPDLRACICNKTVTIRTDLSVLVDNVQYNFSFVDGKAEAITPAPTSETLVIGIIHCNSFIERELNCQFARLLITYAFQCGSQLIGCFDFSIGWCFGGLWDQNQRYLYNVPRANWTLSHYTGIASIMNDKIYTKNEKIIDPFTSKTFTDYYFFPNTSSLAVLSQNYESADLNITYQVDILQTQDYNYITSVLPPPDSVYNSYPITIGQRACIEEMATLDTTDLCTTLTWTEIDEVGWRYPAYTEHIAVTSDQVIYTLTIQFTQNFTGVEVFNPYGELCGSMLSPTEGSTQTFLCLNTPSNFVPKDGSISIRYHGVSALYDLPGLNISPYLSPITDTLSGSVYLGHYSTSAYINLMYGYGYAISALTGVNRNWPQRLPTNQVFPASLYTLNFTSLATSGEITALWEEVSNNILLYNQYPHNYALEARVILKGYGSRDIDYNSEEDLNFLYDIWANWLAPRFASEDVQCETFGLGRAVFDTNGPKQFWLNGETPPGYDIPAGSTEGGCNCGNTFNRGFYDFSLMCQQCLIGYGPLSLDNWADIRQYAQLIQQTYPNEYPFVSTYTAAEFEQNLACRFPIGVDPVVSSLVEFNFCDGHGVVSYTFNELSVNMTFYPYKQYNLIPACTSVILGESELILSNITDIFNLPYTDGDRVLTVVNEAVYLDNVACSLELTQTFPLPFYGSVDCNGEVLSIGCINDILFTEEAVSFSLGGLREYNNWVLFFKA